MKLSMNFLHHQAESWQREVDFLKDEIKIQQARLGEVISKNTHTDVLAEAEHFQNRFIILEEQRQTLLHDVKEMQNKVLEAVKHAPTHIGHKSTEANVKMQQQMQDFASQYQLTRTEFNKFLSRVL